MAAIYAPRNPSQRRMTHELTGDQPADYADWQERPPYSTEADLHSALVDETDPFELRRLQRLIDSNRPLI